MVNIVEPFSKLQNMPPTINLLFGMLSILLNILYVALLVEEFTLNPI